MASTSAKYAPMSLDQVRQIAPSVFAEEPWHEVSDRYTFIPTIKVVEALLSEGWEIMKAVQNRVRIEEKREFTKHVIRFRRPGTDLVVGDIFPEIVVGNAHDRGSAYHVDGGLFRLACLNGMVVDEGTFARQCIRHSGTVIDEVRRGIDYFVKEIPKIGYEVEKMREITLTPNEQGVFAKAAMNLRFEENQIKNINADYVLQPKRYADQSNDLWTTFNVVQENLTKGGIHYVNPAHHDDEGWHPRRRATTREVKGINEDTKLNKALWSLAAEMKKLKLAA